MANKNGKRKKNKAKKTANRVQIPASLHVDAKLSDDAAAEERDLTTTTTTVQITSKIEDDIAERLLLMHR